MVQSLANQTAPSGNLLEMQKLGPYSSPTESDLHLNKISRCPLKCESTGLKNEVQLCERSTFTHRSQPSYNGAFMFYQCQFQPLPFILPFLPQDLCTNHSFPRIPSLLHPARLNLNITSYHLSRQEVLLQEKNKKDWMVLEYSVCTRYEYFFS